MSDWTIPNPTCGPRTDRATLWFGKESAKDGEAKTHVTEMSVLGPDLSRSAPAAAGSDLPPKPESYHIVETPGVIDWRNEVTIPTEENYRALRPDMQKRHPNASRHALGRLISLEALLGIAIVSGFSFGLDKAKMFSIMGERFGDYGGPKGRWPKDDQIKVIRDFARIKSKQHLQQFRGCTSWVCSYLPQIYPSLVKFERIS